MGRQRRSRVHKAQRDTHREARTRVRRRDLDLIQHLDLQPERRKELESQEIQEDKPGLGQHYCVECAKYYETDAALNTHWKGKVHKRRLKNLSIPAYTLLESQLAGGLGGVDNRQRGVEEVVRRSTRNKGGEAEGMEVDEGKA